MERAKVEMPTDDEEAAIQRGIAQDPDNPERGDEWFATARPSVEVLPPATLAKLVKRRGPGKRPAKVLVSFRLDPDIAAALRASGPGWQTRATEALAGLVKAKE